MTAYHKIAEEIAGLVEKRVLRAGDQVPSIRRATRSYRVNPGTVIRAYSDLEARGLIESRPRSGYYVRRVAPRHIPEPAATCPHPNPTPVIVGDLIVELVEAMSGPHLISFGLGVLDPELLPVEDLSRAAAKAARRLKPASVIRDLTPGDPELRRLIALRYLDLGVAIAGSAANVRNRGRYVRERQSRRDAGAVVESDAECEIGDLLIPIKQAIKER